MVVAALDEEVGCVFNLCDLGKISGPGTTPITRGGGGGGSFYGDNVDNKCEEDQIHILPIHPVCDVEMKHFPSALVI